MGTFAQRALVASSLGLCGTPVPITRDVALPNPLFTLGTVLRGLLAGWIPQEPRVLVARLVTCLSLNSSMLSGTPGCRLRARLYRARRLACARMERIGTFPNFKVLGAMCQIQGYTLHLAALVYPPSCFRFRSLHY